MNCLLMSETVAGTVTAYATVLLVLTGLGALCFAWKQISDARKLAQVQHLKDLWRDFHSEPMAGFRHKTARSKLANAGMDETDFFKVLNFFEVLGLLEKRDYLATEDIWEIFSPWIFCYYQELAAIRPELSSSDDPNSYTNLAALCKKLESWELKHNKKWTPKTEDRLTQFW
jgi:hypothetical protein